MLPDFSIRHLKTAEIVEVLKVVTSYTQADISTFIGAAFDNKDLESYVAALDASSYLCFKTILYQQQHIAELRRKAGKVNN